MNCKIKGIFFLSFFKYIRKIDCSVDFEISNLGYIIIININDLLIFIYLD